MATFRFARGKDFDAVAECKAWRARDEQGIAEMAHLLGHLALVNDHGVSQAARDRWSLPDLYHRRSGRASCFYAVKSTARRRAATMLLMVREAIDAQTMGSVESEARRRLKATGFLKE